MTPEDEGLHASMVQRISVAPKPVSETALLRFTVEGMAAMQAEIKRQLRDALERIDRLERAEFCRKLPSNQMERGESE